MSVHHGCSRACCSIVMIPVSFVPQMYIYDERTLIGQRPSLPSSGIRSRHENSRARSVWQHYEPWSSCFETMSVHYVDGELLCAITLTDTSKRGIERPPRKRPGASTTPLRRYWPSLNMSRQDAAMSQGPSKTAWAKKSCRRLRQIPSALSQFPMRCHFQVLQVCRYVAHRQSQ